MSRKTRRLIWSAPLVAVFAVVGALVAFGALGIGGVFANETTNQPMKLKVSPADGNAGRTALVLTWEAPDQRVKHPPATALTCRRTTNHTSSSRYHRCQHAYVYPLGHTRFHNWNVQVLPCVCTEPARSRRRFHVGRRGNQEDHHPRVR